MLEHLTVHAERRNGHTHVEVDSHGDFLHENALLLMQEAVEDAMRVGDRLNQLYDEGTPATKPATEDKPA